MGDTPTFCAPVRDRVQPPLAAYLVGMGCGRGATLNPRFWSIWSADHAYRWLVRWAARKFLHSRVSLVIINPRRMREGYGSRSVWVRVSVTTLAATYLHVLYVENKVPFIGFLSYIDTMYALCGFRWKCFVQKFWRHFLTTTVVMGGIGNSSWRYVVQKILRYHGIHGRWDIIYYGNVYANQALMTTTSVLSESDYRAICRLYSHLLRMEENCDGKYGITVFVWYNS